MQYTKLRRGNMVRAAVRAVWIAVDEDVAGQVAAAVEEHNRLRARLSADPRWRTGGLTRAEAAGVRAAWRTEVHRLRAAGELLDTRDVLAEYGVRCELAERGWDRAWDPAPEEAWEQGRWPGSRDSGVAGYPARVAARLDAELVAQAVAACWHTSWPAIQALRAWRDAHPGITPPRYRLGADGSSRPVGPLAVYERLADQVTTTGAVYRAGLVHGITRARAVLPPA
ncbi:hypothetical protein ACWGJT_32625 [Streptomyces xantholiticus]